MNIHQSYSKFVIFISFLVALAMTIIPLPGAMQPFRPVFCAVILLYWVIFLPHQVSLGIAWLLGITLDILQHTLLGEQALGLVMITFIAFKMHRQIRFFPLWQQSVCIMIFIAIFQFIRFWVQGMIGQLGQSFWYWVPIITSGLLWPIISYIFRIGRQTVSLNKARYF